MAPEILDLDKIIPAQRIVKLSGADIDVSKIPTRIVLEIAKKKDTLDSGTDESFDILLDLVVKICKPSKPDITADWLTDNTTIDQLLQLIQFILKPLQDRVDKTAKNAESPSP